MPQTYAITAVTHQRRSLFMRTANAELFVQLLFRHRSENRYLLHAFVIMPDHIHILLTPAPGSTLARSVQSIKGGFSHAVRNQFHGELWQPGHYEHTIRDALDFDRQKTYIARNPDRRDLLNHPWVNTQYPDQIDNPPPHLK